MNNFKVGDKIPLLQKQCTLTSMVAYAGATWDWHRLHYDMVYLKSKNLDAPVVDGQVFGAYAVQAIQDWLGETAFISSLDLRYAGLVFAEEHVQVSGQISEITKDQIVLSLEINVVKSNGDLVRSAVAPITATVVWHQK
jgi:acyl dehydratase